MFELLHIKIAAYKKCSWPERDLQMMQQTDICALAPKKRNTNRDVVGGGEDRRVDVCRSNCGHWKTIIGYMETSHTVAKMFKC